MLEIVFKILFFLSMLVVYANVTSTSNVIVIVCGYVACVFSYYYFNNIQGAIDEWLNYFNVNARLNDTMNPSQISGYFVNRKYNKINNNSNMPSVGSKKIFSALCSSENTFSKENSLLDSCGPSIMKTEYKSSGDLPSPIMKNGSPSRSNRLSREKLKINFDSKAEISTRKNLQQVYNPLGPTRRYNVNLDLETYMNVNSPGFTSRVVDKAAESASYHMKYPAVRQVSAYRFDKSTLRQLSKMPKANSTPALRIAPPEPATIDLMSSENLTNEVTNDDVRSNNFLQVLKDISRKRNYSQEETDRTGCTPKKSRKTDVKNVLSSQYKRAHEDCSNDSIEDKSRKKRCDDTDRNYAKMMSFTSSMSVLAPEFSWNNHSKKRKSSKLEKSKNESPEKLEKFRKISEDSVEEVEETSAPPVQPKPKSNNTYAVKSKVPEIQVEKESQNDIQDAEETDSKFVEMFPTDDDGEYVRVASGKILNRTNCTYRKKLNNTKIDPVSVIATEPEYVSGSSYVDDKTMKENLLNNLMNDIERKGEKNDSVIFYQNSIVEEIEKNVTHVEVHRTDTAIHTSSSFNPLLPPTSRPVASNVQFSAPAISSPTSESKSNASLSNTSANSSLLTNVLKHNAETNSSFAFGASRDAVDSPKPVPAPAVAEIQSPAVSGASFNPTSTSAPTVISSPTSANSNVKSSPTAPVSLSFGAGNTQTPAFGSVNQENASQSPVFGGTQTTVTQPSVFASNAQTNVSQPSTFSPGTQTSSQGFIFGTSTLSSMQPSVSETSTQPSQQQSILGSTSQVSTSTSVPTKPSLFGSGDTSSNVFGQAQASAPPVSVVNQSPQTLQFGSSTSGPGFTFGTSQQSAFVSTTTAASSFGNATTAQPTFNTNTPSFNFSGASSFGADSNNAFGGTSVSQPTNNQTFSFGSSSAPTAQSAQPSFQFGASTTTSGGQQFTFGGDAARVGQGVDKNTLQSSAQPANKNLQINAPAVSFAASESSTNTSSSASSLFSNVFKSNAEGNGTFSFGASNSSKPVPPLTKIPEPSANLFNATPASAGTISTSSSTPANANMGFSQTSPASSTFGINTTQQSVFGSLTQTNTTQPSIFGSTQANATQPSAFGSNMQMNASQPSVFGSTAQPAPQRSVFGASNTQSSSQPSVFGTSSQQPASQSVFGSTSQVNTGNGAPTQPSLFGAGDTSSNVFGQPQASAPPVGVVNPLPQASQFGSSSNERGFGFGVSQPPAFGSTPAATPAATAFGSVSAVRPAFNANTPSFNFPGSSSFSAGSSNTFGAASAPQPANQQVFEFGSSNAPAAQPSQPTFQFGANTSTMPSSQSFMFAAGATSAPAAATNAGGFSIGSGGSNTRSRAMARPRKTK